MTLLETLALLTFVLALMSLIVDVIRLTVEVMEKFYQHKASGNKKDRLPSYQLVQSIFLAKRVGN